MGYVGARARAGGFTLRTEVIDGAPYADLTEPVAEAWEASYRLALQGGRLVVARLSVSPRGAVPAGGLTTRLLRRVTIGAHLDRAAEITRALISHLTRLEAASTSEDTKALLRRQRQLLAAPRGRRPGQRPADTSRPGRKPLGDDVLLAAAQSYVTARARKHPAPVLAVAKAGKMSEARARDLIYRARRRGFLSQTTQGRGRGDLTDEARALLKHMSKPKPRRSGR
jgi:hypothetical protein